MATPDPLRALVEAVEHQVHVPPGVLPDVLAALPAARAALAALASPLPSEEEIARAIQSAEEASQRWVGGTDRHMRMARAVLARLRGEGQ